VTSDYGTGWRALGILVGMLIVNTILDLDDMLRRIEEKLGWQNPGRRGSGLR
jgi:hypothetical protein